MKMIAKTKTQQVVGIFMIVRSTRDDESLFSFFSFRSFVLVEMLSWKGQVVSRVHSLMGEWIERENGVFSFCSVLNFFTWVV